MAGDTNIRRWLCVLQSAVSVRKAFALLLLPGFSTVFVMFYFASVNVRLQTRSSDIADDDTSLTDTFRPVDTSNHTYVFSAYYDTVDGLGYVRVIGLSLLDQGKVPTMTCTVRGNGTSRTYTTNTTVSILPENHGHKYSAVFILCPVLTEAPPISVSVSSKDQQTVYNRMPIRREDFRNEMMFVMCVPPLHRNYDNINQLIEYVEVYKLLGVDLIVFYKNSVSPRVAKVLEILSRDSIIHVVDWLLPIEAYTTEQGYVNIHYFGQIAAANDCLYRYRFRTRYIINSDLDEIIVPKLTKNLGTWIDRELNFAPNAAAFVLRTYLLYSFLPDHKAYFPMRQIAKKYKLMSLLKTNRTGDALPGNIRTKYMFDPKRVVSTGVHNVLMVRKNFIAHLISTENCAVYHYRNAMLSPSPNGSVIDTYFHTMQYDIAERVDRRWHILQYELNMTVSL